MNKSNRIFFYVISRRWPWLDVVLPLCACFFPFVQSFVVRLALYSIISLCIVFIIPQEWGILWYNWVRVYCHCHFHLKQGCHVQNDHSAQKREIRCRREFTLNILSLNYHVFVVEKKKSILVYSWTECGLVLHLSVHVGRLWLTLIVFATSCSLSCICFCFPSLLYLFAPLFANYDFAVFPDAFPLYNIRQRKETQKEKKNHLAYFSL